MATTSSESSNPSLNLSSIASAQMAPTMSPSRMPQPGARMLQAGVMATRPATAPDAAPIEVGLPSLIFSTINQPMVAAAGAASVLTQARAEMPSTAPSEPALKPNQPNQSSAAPRRVRGTL